MAKKASLKPAEKVVVPRKKYRKLTKAEEEEYTHEMNAVWARISKAIQAGQIVLPEWRRNS